MWRKKTLPNLPLHHKYSLKKLSERVLDRCVQGGPHTALVDAQATMALFKAGQTWIMDGHVWKYTFINRIVA